MRRPGTEVMSRVTQLDMDELGKTAVMDRQGQRVRNRDSMQRVFDEYAEHSSMHGVWRVANAAYPKLRRLV